MFAGTAFAAQAHPLSFVAAPAATQPVVYQQYAQAQNTISYAQAKSIARSQYKGSQVVDISLEGQTYRVRLQVKDGRVVDVYVDATTGRVQ